MRILHTADWHAGRTLRGVDRTSEIYDALREILEIAKSERVDAILVSGDLFDTPNPRAEAEAAVYNFFLETGQAGIPSVVIAGNHDSPQRLESVAGLLRRVSVAAVGTIRANSRFAVNLENSKGEKAVIAALPFLSERRLVKAAQLLDGDVGQWRMKYQEGMDFFIGRMEREFKSNTVNLMMLHTTIEGGALSGSEFKFLTQNSYTIRADQLPRSAQYIALGHLHKPQRVGDAPPAEYAGSLIQLDFGEAGEQKYVKIIDAVPGRPAFVESIPIRSGKQLRSVHVTLEKLEHQLEEFKNFDGYLKVAVKVNQPLPGLKDRVLAVLPQALAVEVELEAGVQQAIVEAAVPVSPLEAFERYVSERRSGGLSEEVRKAFMELFEQSTDAETTSTKSGPLPESRATISESFTAEEPEVLRAGPRSKKRSDTIDEEIAVEKIKISEPDVATQQTASQQSVTTEIPKPSKPKNPNKPKPIEPEKLGSRIDDFVASTSKEAKPVIQPEPIIPASITPEKPINKKMSIEERLEKIIAESAKKSSDKIKPVSLPDANLPEKNLGQKISTEKLATEPTPEIVKPLPEPTTSLEGFEFETEPPELAFQPENNVLPALSESAEIRRKKILDWDDDETSGIGDIDLSKGDNT